MTTPEPSAVQREQARSLADLVRVDQGTSSLDRIAQALADAEVLGYQRGHAHAEATVPGADRGALVDVLGAANRLGLEALRDDETEPVSYAPATVLALRDAVRRANRRIDRSPT